MSIQKDWVMIIGLKATATTTTTIRTISLAQVIISMACTISNIDS